MTHGRPRQQAHEIIEYDVTTKLRETVERRANFRLSEARAREGAEWLAVATILCKQQQFNVPGGPRRLAQLAPKVRRKSWRLSLQTSPKTKL